MVVDSGLCREPLFDPKVGMTRLATRRISKAAATQRAGRAGRLMAGRCYRLWSEGRQAQLASHPDPEILQADLLPLALQMLVWGVSDVAELQWLDLPPAAAMGQALDLLQSLGAATMSSSGVWQATSEGEQMADLPVHPRFAHMMRVGASIGALEAAALVAAVLSERAPPAERGGDLCQRVSLAQSGQGVPAQQRGWVKQIQQQAKRLVQLCRGWEIQARVDCELGVQRVGRRAYRCRLSRSNRSLP